MFFLVDLLCYTHYVYWFVDFIIFGEILGFLVELLFCCISVDIAMMRVKMYIVKNGTRHLVIEGN